ncbi:acyl-CoA dehydrogenase family protein (plasmid) [Rhodococcus erythropolis]|uniref:acyl-CoA dehydrogenase family protein n=1 Tax=Rhodococcus erythropolis TaxID=1833 RepID=UPI00406BB47E
MSEIIEALTGAVEDACVRHPSSADEIWNAGLWAALDQIGITLLSIDEESGGGGGDLSAAAAVLEVLGEFGAEVPFVETALQGAWLLASCGAEIPAGPIAAASAASGITLALEDGEWTIDGELARVPWARISDYLVVLVGRHVVLLDRGEVEIEEGVNMAGEPRDRVTVRRRALPAERVYAIPDGSEVTEELFLARGALGRMAMTSGAARRALRMSMAYASARTQFGRQLVAFQSVQHQIAKMAGEVMLCKTVSRFSALALDERAPSWQFEVAAAQVSSGQAAGTVAKIAHQVHGAIGFTEEHDLRLITTRIWSWRDELGGARLRADQVGEHALAVGPDGLWPLLVGA